MSLTQTTRCLYISRSPPKTDRYLLQPATVYIVHITSPMYIVYFNLKNILGGRACSGTRRSRSREVVGVVGSPGRRQRVDNFGVQVGCPKTPVKGKCRAKAQGGSVQLKSPRCDTPTTTPPLSRTRTKRRVACVGKKEDTTITRTSPDAHDALA